MTEEIKLKEAANPDSKIELNEYLNSISNSFVYTKYNIHCLTRATIFAGLLGNRPELSSKTISELIVLADNINREFYDIDQQKQASKE